MKYSTKLGITITLIFFSCQIMAASKSWTMNGRLKQGGSVMYDLDDQSATSGPANYLGEFKWSWRPNRQLTVIGNAWLRGDWAPSGDSIHSTTGLADPTSAGFLSGLPYHINEGNCNGSANNSVINTHCASSRENRQFNDLNEVLRELSVKYRDKKNRFSIKLGKQQRGWGQSDGLRLMDVLHAQDLRERFVFRDSDELRVPAFMISADFNFKKMGIANAFEFIGMKRPVFEFNFTPEVHHSRFNINNPNPSTSGGSSSGGAFGLPYPVVSDPKSNSGWPGFGFDIRDKSAKRWSFDDAEYSARLKFDTLGGQATINAFYGMQDLPTMTLQGGTLIIGNAFNNTSGAGTLAIPLTAQDVATVVNGGAAGGGFLPTGAGGYLTFLRDLAAGTPSASPLTDLSGLVNGVLGTPICLDPTGLSVFSGAATVPCSINGIVDLDYTHRQKVLGFTFARDLGDFKALRLGPKNTSPTMRLEVSHEFGKVFNRSSVVGPATSTAPIAEALGIVPVGTQLGQNGTTETGTPVFGQLEEYIITKSDVTSTMLGFDFPLWVPGWDTQDKSIFTSFQFFNIHTYDADKGLLQQAPYAYTVVPDDQRYATFLWNAPLDHGRLVLNGLWIRDFHNDGTFYRQRVDLNYFGKSWRPRVEWMHFEGDGEAAPIGLFDDKDFVEVSLTYQF